MAKKALFVPTKPQFFKPLLPGYVDKLDIPKSFFFKYLKEEDCRKAVLRGRGGKLWHVEMDGTSFVGGWADFVKNHDLEIGYFLVFGYEGEMVFDVVVFDLSTCKKDYPPTVDPQQVRVKQGEEVLKEETAEEFSRGNFSKEKEDSAATLKAEAGGSMPEHPRFKMTLAPYYAKNYVLHIPRAFVNSTNLRGKCGKVVLEDEQRREFPAKLKYNQATDQVSIRSGWRDFYQANGLEEGHTVMFELIEKGQELRFRVSYVLSSSDGLQAMPEAREKPNCRNAQVGSSSAKRPHFRVTLSATNVKNSLHIPRDFARSIDVADRSCEMILTKGKAGSWSVSVASSPSRTYIGGGWRTVVREGKLKEGDVVNFKLIQGGSKPVLKFKGTAMRKRS